MEANTTSVQTKNKTYEHADYIKEGKGRLFRQHK